MKKSAIAVLILSAFAASSAMAAGNKMESSIAGSIDFQSSPTSSTTGMVLIDQGFYLSPELVARGSLMEFLSDGGAGTSSAMMSVGGGVKYYLGKAAKSAVVPFVLGGVGFSLLSSSTPVTCVGATCFGGTTTDTGFSFQGGAGVALFITEDVSADGTLQYYSNSFGSVTVDGLRLNVGITARY